MRALTVEPGVADSIAVTDVPDPEPGPRDLLVEGVAVGVCGTDHELAGGGYGWAPEGRSRLVIGHESLGRVISAPDGSGFAPGDMVAGIVRRPDPVPCGACEHGAFDMCRNGRYTERGIKELDGYASERWIVDQDFVVGVDAALGTAGALVEPTSVVAKAWDEVYRIGERSWFSPRTAVVTGAGPIGLLAAMIGRRRGLDVHVVDVVDSGPKPDLVRDLGASYHHEPLSDVLSAVEPDVVVETTGVSGLLADLLRYRHPYSIVCLLGMHDPQDGTGLDLASLGKGLVLDNGVVFGSVNANRDHWKQAADALGRTGVDWVQRLVTRTVPLSRATDALDRQPDDVKVVIDLQS